MTMAKTVDRDKARHLREESERTKDAPYPAGAKFTRPNRERSRVYSIRLSEEEYAAVQEVADAAHLPPATLVRSWILSRLEQERSA